MLCGRTVYFLSAACPGAQVKRNHLIHAVFVEQRSVVEAERWNLKYRAHIVSIRLAKPSTLHL